MTDHWFWWGLTMASVAWYSTIVFYVAFKGVKEIRSMLKRLATSHDHAREQGP